MSLAIKPPSQMFLGLRHAFLPNHRLPKQAGTCVHLCSWVRNVWRSRKGVCVWGYSICCTKRTWNNQLSMDWFSTKRSWFLKNFLSSVSLTSHGCFFFAFTSVIRRLPAHTGRGVLLEWQIASNRSGVRGSDRTIQRLKGVISILFGDLFGNRASMRLGLHVHFRDRAFTWSARIMWFITGWSTDILRNRALTGAPFVSPRTCSFDGLADRLGPLRVPIFVDCFTRRTGRSSATAVYQKTIGWFSNMTGPSVDDGKTRGKD